MIVNVQYFVQELFQILQNLNVNSSSLNFLKGPRVFSFIRYQI